MSTVNGPGDPRRSGPGGRFREPTPAGSAVVTVPTLPVASGVRGDPTSVPAICSPAAVPSTTWGEDRAMATGTEITAGLKLPGRLGNPGLEMRGDPRADPRMIAALAPFGLDGAGPPRAGPGRPHVRPAGVRAGDRSRLRGAVRGAGRRAAPGRGGHAPRRSSCRRRRQRDHALPPPPGRASGRCPACYTSTAAAWCMLEAAGDSYERWRDELAATGLVVVGVEFRNGAGKHGPLPFPAGLDDCAVGAALGGRHRGELGITTLVVSGESGGGNLTLATALKAKRDGRLDADRRRLRPVPLHLRALRRRAIRRPGLAATRTTATSSRLRGWPALAKAYDPGGATVTTPLAGRTHADVSDLAGMPPHVISVNELDPLRDEGLAYYRKLLAARRERRGPDGARHLPRRRLQLRRGPPRRVPGHDPRHQGLRPVPRPTRLTLRLLRRPP